MDEKQEIPEEETGSDKLRRVFEEVEKESSKFREMIKDIESPNFSMKDFRDPLLADEQLSRALAGPVIDRLYNPEVFRNNGPSHAKQTYDILHKYIRKFEMSLDNEHEIGAQLVSFGREYTFNIQYIHYSDPDFILFEGLTQNNERVQLIQNTVQLNVLFLALPKVHDEPKRIGKLGFVGVEES